MKGSEQGALVRVSNVSKAYMEGGRRRLVLDSVTTAFGRGELAVIVGRSGSGKSTLLNLISGIDQPDAGSISVGSETITALSERDRTLFRRHAIGFVFQAFNLIPTLTVLENLLLPMELRGARDEPRAVELLRRVGLDERRDSFPDRLSGGERQRVAIARALAHEPELILADEPTGNLDFETGASVMDLLEVLVREEKKTMLVATHDRDLLVRADRVVELKGGKLHSADAAAGKDADAEPTMDRNAAPPMNADVAAAMKAQAVER